MTDRLTWGAYRQPDGTYDAAAKYVYDPPVHGTLHQSGLGWCGYKWWPVAYLVSLGQALKVYRIGRRWRRQERLRS